MSTKAFWWKSLSRCKSSISTLRFFSNPITSPVFLFCDTFLEAQSILPHWPSQISDWTLQWLFFFAYRDQTRLPSETRDKAYLKEEFRKRLQGGPLRYKLQLTLHLPQSDDPVDILNVARYWDEATHPWLDVADVTMVVLLSPDATENMCFNPGNLAPCLELLPARSIHQLRSSYKEGSVRKDPETTSSQERIKCCAW